MMFQSSMCSAQTVPRIKKAKDHDVKRMFMFIRLTQAACAAYIVVVTFAREPIGLLREDNTIHPRDTVMATTPLHFVCLGISRISAYSMYPALVLVFLSKAKALQTWLESTVVSIFIPLYELHTVHEAMGHWIAVDVWIHTVFHTIRWADQGNLHLIWTTDTGRSGFLVLAITPFITLPMMFEFLKARLSFELRKTLHLLCIPFGVGIVFHAPAMHIGLVMGTVTAIFLADYAVRWLCMTHKIKSSQFVRLDAGSHLTFENPKQGFGKQGGYILLNVPFVSRTEWHAFSIFAHPTLANHSSVCVALAGDWTSALHHAVQRPTVRPIWIQGPFASPFKSTEDYDNLVLVAVGVGITPAMAALNRFKDDGRTYSLVWACRDASLIEYFAHSIAREASGWVLIYYTGARPLHVGADAQRLPPNVRVFRGRPNMQGVIARLIGGVESGTWLPDDMLSWSRAFFRMMAAAARNASEEQEGESAMIKIKSILKTLCKAYAPQDMFQVLVQTLCNMESDRDDLDAAAIADLFRSMVSPLEHPRAEERAFMALFDPLCTGTVSDLAFSAAIQHILSEPDPLPDQRAANLLSPLTEGSSRSLRSRHVTCTGRTGPQDESEPGRVPRLAPSASGFKLSSPGRGSSLSPTVVADVVVEADLLRAQQEMRVAYPPGMSAAELRAEIELEDTQAGRPGSPARALDSSQVQVQLDLSNQDDDPLTDQIRSKPSGPENLKDDTTRGLNINLKPPQWELTRADTQRWRRWSSRVELRPLSHSTLLEFAGPGRGTQLERATAASDHPPTLPPDYLQHLRACRPSGVGSASFLERSRGEQEEALESQETRATWQVLFCGGPSPSLQSAMHEVARNLGVSLRTETFDW